MFLFDLVDENSPDWYSEAGTGENVAWQNLNIFAGNFNNSPNITSPDYTGYPQYSPVSSNHSGHSSPVYLTTGLTYSPSSSQQSIPHLSPDQASPTYSPPYFSPAYGAVSPAYIPISPSYGVTSPQYSPTYPQYSPTSPTYSPASPQYSPTSPPCSQKHTLSSSVSVKQEELVASPNSTPQLSSEDEVPIPWSQCSSDSTELEGRLLKGPETAEQNSQTDSLLQHSPLYDPETTNYTPSSPQHVEGSSDGINPVSADKDQFLLKSPSNSSCSSPFGTPLQTHPSPAGSYTALLARVNTDSNPCYSSTSTPKSISSSQNTLSPIFPQTPRLYDSPDMFGVERPPQSELTSLSQASMGDSQEGVPSAGPPSPVMPAETVIGADETTRAPWRLSQASNSDTPSWLSSLEYGPTPLGCGMGYTDATQ